MAEAFLDKGWHVTGTVRAGSGRTKLHDLADRFDGRLDIETLDICEPVQLAALRERLSGRRFDMLFVNAGTTNGTETIGEVTTDEFVRVMITNALAPMRVIETLQDLVTDDGLIGAMSSGQGSVANNVSGMREVYRGSKAALNQFMRSFAVRHRYAACNGADGARLGPHGTRWAGCAPDDRGKRAESRRRADRKAWAPAEYLDYLGRTVPW